MRARTPRGRARARSPRRASETADQRRSRTNRGGGGEGGEGGVEVASRRRVYITSIPSLALALVLSPRPTPFTLVIGQPCINTRNYPARVSFRVPKNDEFSTSFGKLIFGKVTGNFSWK